MGESNAIDFMAIAGQQAGPYYNTLLTGVNDQIVKLSVMTEPFYWHYHPNSDETFIGVEGVVIIEMEDNVVELGPGQIFTVPRNVSHFTRPKNNRSVNLTVEYRETETIKE